MGIANAEKESAMCTDGDEILSWGLMQYTLVLMVRKLKAALQHAERAGANAQFLKSFKKTHLGTSGCTDYCEIGQPCLACCCCCYVCITDKIESHEAFQF